MGRRALAFGLPKLGLAERKGLDGLSGRQPTQIGHEHFHDETPARAQVGRRIGEARNLFVLAGEVHDRVVRNVNEAEGAIDSGDGEVAEGQRDAVPSGLFPQARGHGRRELDPVDLDVALPKGERDAAGAHPELEDRAHSAHSASLSTAGPRTSLSKSPRAVTSYSEAISSLK